MPNDERSRRLIPLGIAGALLLVLGVAAALWRLPEWRNEAPRDEAFYAARLTKLAAQAGFTLQGTPRVELRNASFLNNDLPSFQHTAHEMLGADAAGWLTSQRAGPYMRVTAATPNSNLAVVFTLAGEPVAAALLPANPFGAPRGSGEERDRRAQALTRLFTTSGRATEIEFLGEMMHVIPLPGTSPAQSIIALRVRNETMGLVHRIVGTPETLRARFAKRTPSYLIATEAPGVIGAILLYLGTFVIFVMLIAQRRIELLKGLIIGGASIALSFIGPIRNAGNTLQLIETMFGVIGRGIGLFILWSTAESWLRSTLPGFRTSLDTLRAGRLGKSSGRALLAGSAIGAGLGGLWLLIVAATTLTDMLAPSVSSTRVPPFGASASPLDEGVIRAGIVMLAICAAFRMRVLQRIPGGAVILGGFLLTTRIQLNPTWFAFLAAIVLVAILGRVYAWYGLTALLAASVAGMIAPATIFSFVHAQWLAVPGLVLLAILLLPIVFGVIGIRRGEEVEHVRLPVPAFVRRLEEERRLKYEMELLTRMQLGLLPQQTPRIDGYEIAAKSILATEAGGDLYDFLEDENGRMWIAAGDVSGHGYSCAIAQAMTKAGLASLVEADRTPAAVLERLDHVLRGMNSSRTFTTLVLLRLDPATGEALVSNAGHPYPMIARNGDATSELEVPSLPLGQGPPRKYADVPLSIPNGTSIVMCSDGLYEATDAEGSPYGYDRLRSFLGLAKISLRPAPAILDAIVEDWRKHVGAESPADDTTIVIIQRKW